MALLRLRTTVLLLAGFSLVGIGVIDASAARKPTRAAHDAVSDPSFALHRLSDGERRSILGATEIEGPLRYTVRAPFLDEGHYLEIESRGGHADLRGRGDHAYFHGADAEFSTLRDRPSAQVHFLGEPGRRYLLECGVEAQRQGTTFAAIAGAQIARVSGSDHATLRIVVDPASASAAADVRVDVGGDRAGWFLEGCDLWWTSGS